MRRLPACLLMLTLVFCYASLTISPLNAAGKNKTSSSKKKSDAKKREEAARKKREEAARKKREEEKRRREREARRKRNSKKNKNGEKDKLAYEQELEKARKQGQQQALALSEQNKSPSGFVPIEAASGKELSWTGTLSKESVLLDATENVKPVSALVLTTKDGERIVLSTKSVAEYSLSGQSLSLMVGQEITLKAIASARMINKKAFHLASSIKSVTKKESALFDDLGE